MDHPLVPGDARPGAFSVRPRELTEAHTAVFDDRVVIATPLRRPPLDGPHRTSEFGRSREI
jgi:hypothetical protein